MKPDEILIELLDRLAGAEGRRVWVCNEELAEWPKESVAALKTQGLLSRDRHPPNVICPGCEEACAMPVENPPADEGKGRGAFVVCDKRDDINRVAISRDLLIQWRCSVEQVVQFIADQLGVRRTGQRSSQPQLWPVGVAGGNMRHQMLCLGIEHAELVVKCGQSYVPLVDLIKYKASKYGLIREWIHDLVDRSDSADPRYTPNQDRREAGKMETEARYEAWRQAYARLKEERPGMSDVWYSRQIAKLPIADGKNAETIRRRLKR